MTQQSNQANHFELTGADANSQQVQITYDVMAIDGQPHLTYQDARGSKTYIGNQISAQDSPLGPLLTVGVFQSIDAGSTTLTLLLPGINMRGTTQQPYETLAILASSHGILPEQVPDLTYGVFNLRGTARIVES